MSAVGLSTSVTPSRHSRGSSRRSNERMAEASAGSQRTLHQRAGSSAAIRAAMRLYSSEELTGGEPAFNFCRKRVAGGRDILSTEGLTPPSVPPQNSSVRSEAFACQLLTGCLHASAANTDPKTPSIGARRLAGLSKEWSLQTLPSRPRTPPPRHPSASQHTMSWLQRRRLFPSN